MLTPNELPDAPEWSTDPRPWDSAMCCPADCEQVCEVPRSVQDIIENADELARRFEDYEPRTTKIRSNIILGTE